MVHVIKNLLPTEVGPNIEGAVVEFYDSPRREVHKFRVTAQVLSMWELAKELEGQGIINRQAPSHRLRQRWKSHVDIKISNLPTLDIKGELPSDPLSVSPQPSTSEVASTSGAQQGNLERPETTRQQCPEDQEAQEVALLVMIFRQE